MTKKELLEYYKNLIYKVGLCPSIKTNHFEIYLELMDLFTNHPDYPEKIENVVDLAIVKNKMNFKYLELQIIKEDNSTDNISYRCCIHKPNKDRNLKNAMRYAVYPQIIQFRENCENLKCAFCQSSENIQIDHILLFKELCNEFLKDRKCIPSVFDDNFYNSAKFQKDDKQFENEWIEFHRENATLRCLCKSCNLARGKK
jgi:hypothetical protein